jgi:hypothetical protein
MGSQQLRRMDENNAIDVLRIIRQKKIFEWLVAPYVIVVHTCSSSHVRLK